MKITLIILVLVVFLAGCDSQYKATVYVNGEEVTRTESNHPMLVEYTAPDGTVVKADSRGGDGPVEWVLKVLFGWMFLAD